MPFPFLGLAPLTALAAALFILSAGSGLAVSPGTHHGAHHGHHHHMPAHRRTHRTDPGCPRGMQRDPQAVALHDGRPLRDGCRRVHGPGFIARHFHRHRYDVPPPYTR